MKYINVPVPAAAQVVKIKTKNSFEKFVQLTTILTNKKKKKINRERVAFHTTPQ